MTRAVVLAAVASATALGGLTTRDGKEPRLEWAQPPQIVHGATGTLLAASVINRSPTPLPLRAGDVRVLAANGEAFRGVTVTFAAGFGHSLYGASGDPRRLGPRERRRLGHERLLEPGESSPLHIAWRGGARPSRVVVAGVALPAPAEPSPATERERRSANPRVRLETAVALLLEPVNRAVRRRAVCALLKGAAVELS